MTNNNTNYAGFWVRLLAFAIDIIILSLILNIIVKITGSFILGSVVIWLYFAVSISQWETTLGGKIIGIKFYSTEGEKLSFLSASLRVMVSFAPFVLYLFIRGMQHTMTFAPSLEVQMLPQFIVILAPLVMWLTIKRQMIHDIVAKSIVLDDNKKVESKATFSNDFTFYGRKIIRVIGIILFLASMAYIVIYTSIFYNLAKSSQVSYNASFHSTYQTKDFNDTRIIFYQKELERYSKEFIEAEGMYDIFASDVKRDLALNCIESLLQEHNQSNWLEMGDYFRKNARNKYANTNKKIQKAKRNEDWVGRNFYYYDLNDVNYIEEKIIDKWEPKKNTQTCNALMPIEQIYQMFLIKYVKNRKDALAYYKEEIANGNKPGYSSKSFYENKIKDTKNWIEMLYLNNPKLKALMQKAEQEAKLREKQKQLEAIKKKQKELWIVAKEGILHGMGYFKGINANIKNAKGQTPLMIAVKNGRIDVINALAEANVNVWTKDNEGKTAYDYIQKGTNRKSKIHQKRMYASLRRLELAQTVKSKVKIAYSSYSYDTDKLFIVIVDGKCEDFNFPKNTKCLAFKSLKRGLNDSPEKRYESDIKRDVPPIFAAIQNHLYSKLRKLLNDGVDIEQKNKFGDTPLFFAIYQNDSKLVKILLKYGANPNVIDRNGLYTPLSEAISSNNMEIVKLLLKHGANVNYQYKKCETALTEATKGCKKFELVKLLLKHGANPKIMDTYDKNTITGLHRYCKEGENYQKMLKLLMGNQDFRGALKN